MVAPAHLRPVAAVVPVAAVLLLGCSSGRDRREWRPSDHDGDPAATAPLPASRPIGSERAEPDIDESVLDVWRARCVRCHGPAGRGDGPDGALLRAADLTAPARVPSRSDAELRATILKGRGAMPGFGQEGPLLDGLVQVVRLLAGQPRPGSSASPARAAAAPSAEPVVPPSAAPVATSRPARAEGSADPHPAAHRPAPSAALPATVTPPLKASAP